MQTAGWFESEGFSNALLDMKQVDDVTLKGDMTVRADDTFPHEFRDQINTIALHRLKWRQPDEVGRLLRLFHNAETVSVLDTYCYSQAAALAVEAPTSSNWAIHTLDWERTYTDHSNSFKRHGQRTAVAGWFAGTLARAQVSTLMIADNLIGVLAALVPAWHASLTTLNIDFAGSGLLHPGARPWGPSECILLMQRITTH